MDFDFGMLKEGLASLAAAIGIFKQIKDSLPEGSKKEEADEALMRAERQLQLAESQIAQGLKYEPTLSTLCGSNLIKAADLFSKQA